MKRIVSIQDLSCIGKCTQSKALPDLSAMGIHSAAMPTAHYTGYLGSEALIGLVLDLLRDFCTAETIVFVDPVMGDHGTLYAGLSPALPEQMKALCRYADFITPNVTEACLLTGLPYRERHDEAFIRTLSERLLTLGAKNVIITGVRMNEAQMGVAAADAEGNLSLHMTAHLPGEFYGTRDLFASTCVGALTLGYSAADAIALAADYVVQTIRATTADPNARWYGVNFEDTLPALMTRLHRLPQKEETT